MSTTMPRLASLDWSLLLEISLQTAYVANLQSLAGINGVTVPEIRESMARLMNASLVTLNGKLPVLTPHGEDVAWKYVNR